MTHHPTRTRLQAVQHSYLIYSWRDLNELSEALKIISSGSLFRRKQYEAKKIKIIIGMSKWLVKSERVSSAGVVMRAFPDSNQSFRKITEIMNNFE